MRLAFRRLDRRKVLAATGLGLFAAVVAACSSSDKEPAAGNEPVASPTAGGTAPTTAAPKVIAKTSEVPVGSGVIIDADEIVLTQPSAGVFTGLSAICTHQGCTVNKVADATIDCPCHGSKYNLDGSVANGPATRPLPPKAISVQGDSILRG